VNANNSILEIINLINNNHLDRALDFINNKKDIKQKNIILNLKGVIYFKKKNYKLAKESFLESIKNNENFLDPYKNLYLLNLNHQNFNEAINYAKKITQLEENHKPESFFKLAHAYEMNGNLNEAIKYYEYSYKIGFEDKKLLYNNLGNIYLKLDKLDRSEDYFLKALNLDKNNKIITNNLLRNYLRARNYGKVEIYIKKAELLDKENEELKFNRALYLIAKNKFNEAILILKELISVKKNILAITSLAYLYLRLSRINEARLLIDKFLIMYPDNCDLKFFKGIMLLNIGEFEEGWKLYEFRKSNLNKIYNNINKWEGENLSQKNILVYNEQGLGDALQFSKYVIGLSKKSKEVDLIINDKLYPIFNKKLNNINILKKEDIINKKYDFKISLGSLNKFFYNKISSNKDNLINFNKSIFEEWRNKIDQNKTNIGLVWSSNFLGSRATYRSIELKKFSKIVSLNANFYCLQNEIWQRDKIFFNNSKIINYGNFNFEEISAIISNLDLVISIDTSLLHLSCLLNKETWGLLSAFCDWRWGSFYNYNKYETLKLFRQTKIDEWDDVLNKVESDLLIKINKKLDKLENKDKYPIRS
jgi:tetratricopeptide (TPR) repeat protein